MADDNAKSRLHIFTTIFAIMLGMTVLDAYLVEQNTGSRRTGVLVMLLIGDVCLLFVLRYVGVWVGTEVRSTKRGCSMAEWFLLIFVLDIKMYFIMENVRKECFEAVETAKEEQETKQQEVGSIFQPQATFTGNENLTTEELMLAYSQIGVRSKYDSVLKECDYTMKTKKLLTLFQAVFIPGFYLLLLGADYLETVSSLRELDEIKMRALWVVVDLLDLLDLQSSMWESKQGELPYLTVGFIYFYCYIILIILPPLSFAEISTKNESRPHEMLIYLIASFVTINVATTSIRVVLLVNNNFFRVSSIFIAKNVICMFMKGTKVVQIHLVNNRKLRYVRDDPNHFTLNDLRKDDRNHVAYSDASVDGRKTIDVQVRSDGSPTPAVDGKPRRHRPDGTFTRKGQPAEWSPEVEKEEEAEEKLPMNNAKKCNAFLTKMGDYSSPATVSHKAGDFTAGDFTAPDKWSNWRSGCLDSSRKIAGEYKSMEEILKNNLSPENSSDKLCKKMSRSISATLDAYSDGSIEKRVRFQKEKLSPVVSEDRAADDKLRPRDSGPVEPGNNLIVLLPNMPPPGSLDPSSGSSLSTTDCGTRMDSINEWNTNVINQIEALRSTLRRENINREIEQSEEAGQQLHNFFATVSSRQSVELDEEDKFPFRLPSPILDSLPNAIPEHVELLSSHLGYESSGSLRSDILSPFSPIASAITSSPSLESSTATSAASASGILPQPMEACFSRFRHFEPRSLSGNGLFNGLDSPSVNGTKSGSNFMPTEEENDFVVRKPPLYQNSVDSGHLSDTAPFLKRSRPKMVNAASQTNMAQTTTI